MNDLSPFIFPAMLRPLIALAVLSVFPLAACAGSSPKTAVVRQDRNGPCHADRDCIKRFTCDGATRDVPGRCAEHCRADRDCGNDALCRDGACQRDCAGLGEKCSLKRECCFEDQNADGETDSACTKDAGGELRCQVPAH